MMPTAIKLLLLFALSLPLWAAPRLRATGTQYWRGYRVLFVNVDYPRGEVLRLAEKRGIVDVVTETPPPDAAALFGGEPLLLPPLAERGDSYYNRRKGLFFDKSGAYRLFYIPDRHEKAIPPLVSDLGAGGADALWDGMASTGPKRGSGGVPAKLWILGIGSLVLLSEVYVARKIWCRKGWLRYFCAKPYTMPPLVLVILVNTFFSIPQGLLLIAASAGILRGRLWWERRQERGGSGGSFFVPRPIRPAVLVSLGGGTTKRVLGIAAALCFVLGIFAAGLPSSLVRTQKMIKNGIKGLSFPAPSGYTNDVLDGDVPIGDLPDLSHYVRWVYDGMIFPYRSLHDASRMRDSSRRGETPECNHFGEQHTHGYVDYKVEKGRIVEVTIPEPVLNREFAGQVLSALDKAPENVIEQVLKKQGDGGFRRISWTMP